MVIELWVWMLTLVFAVLVGFHLGRKETKEDVVMRGLGRYNPMTKQFEWVKNVLYRKSDEPLEYERDTKSDANEH